MWSWLLAAVAVGLPVVWLAFVAGGGRGGRCWRLGLLVWGAANVRGDSTFWVRGGVK